MNRLRSFGNNFYTVGILILEVTEGRRDDDACFLLLSVASGHTAAAVSGVEVVHQSFEADDQIVGLVEGVDILRGGQHPDMILPQVVDEQSGLGSMPAQPGQVFDDDCIDAFGVHCFAQLGDAFPVEVHAGDVVVEGLAHDIVSVTESIAFDDAALVHQGVQFFIFVTGQAVVKPYLLGHYYGVFGCEKKKVADIALELEMTPDGVYKAIKTAQVHAYEIARRR